MPDHDRDMPRPEDMSADADLAALMDRLGAMESELEAAKSRSMRLMADFQNFQRRAANNEVVAKQSGISSVATSVVGVLDHFDVALRQDLDRASAQQILEGVRVIREELLRSLSKHGVAIIEPRPNDEFRPGIHEAVMQQPMEGVESGCVSMCLQPGYVLREGDAERVIRAAKVSVAP
jgi:molecular chaperone GrpE